MPAAKIRIVRNEIGCKYRTIGKMEKSIVDPSKAVT
jgi:hypothetical protein